MGWLLTFLFVALLRAQDALPASTNTTSQDATTSAAGSSASSSSGAATSAASAPEATAQESSNLAPPSVAEKWRLFDTETVSPLTLEAGAFNAAISQITRSAPLYGRHPWPYAYPKRFGASVGDIVSQNFFGDFLLASAFHEDTRYVRWGPTHGLWGRIGYAISRGVVTRTDSGDATLNWANMGGTAMSAALSNAYYPPVSRTVRVSVMNWGTDIAGSGLVNLMPEFLPDFKRWVKRHLPSHHSH